MKARLFTTQSSNVSSLCDQGLMHVCLNNSIRQFEVLAETTWPSDVPCGFGEDEVTELCRRFRLPCDLTVNAFRDYTDAGGWRMPADLQPPVNCTHVIPSSTAECERGFSHMNIIVSDTRSMLLVSHVSSLLFIKLHGPLLKSWNPTRYTKTWLRKHLSATDTQTRVAVSQDKTKDSLWQFFWRVCRPKLFKNLCLSLVSGVPPLLVLGLHPWLKVCSGIIGACVKKGGG